MKKAVITINDKGKDGPEVTIKLSPYRGKDVYDLTPTSVLLATVIDAINAATATSGKT